MPFAKTQVRQQELSLAKSDTGVAFNSTSHAPTQDHTGSSSRIVSTCSNASFEFVHTLKYFVGFVFIGVVASIVGIGVHNFLNVLWGLI